MPFVYHWIPPDFIGDTLYPLNELKLLYPEAYAKHVKKYEGREYLLKERISPLDCLWNDVLHFGPTAPKILAHTHLSLFPNSHLPARKFFRIPITELEESKTVLAFPSAAGVRYEKFCASTYREPSKISEEQIAHWKEMAAANKPVLLFTRTMHVLYLGSIPRDKLEEIGAT